MNIEILKSKFMIKGDESAMPTISHTYEDGSISFNECGLTIRQHFAVMAMQGLLANPTLSNITSNEHLCKSACRIAGLLIDELNKEK